MNRLVEKAIEALNSLTGKKNENKNWDYGGSDRNYREPTEPRPSLEIEKPEPKLPYTNKEYEAEVKKIKGLTMDGTLERENMMRGLIKEQERREEYERSIREPYSVDAYAEEIEEIKKLTVDNTPERDALMSGLVSKQEKRKENSLKNN